MSNNLRIVVHTILLILMFVLSDTAVLSADQHLQNTDPQELPLTISLHERFDGLKRPPYNSSTRCTPIFLQKRVAPPVIRSTTGE